MKCDFCDKEFKSKSGLTRHQKSCKPSKETVEEPINQAIEEQTLLSVDNDKIQRKIDKLLSHRSSTYDAHTRHQIDLQIAELRKSL